MGKVKFFAKRSDNNKSTGLFTINQTNNEIKVVFSVDDNGKKELFTYTVNPTSPLPPVTGELDPNGVMRIALPAGMTYTNESYEPHENLRPDGSYRLDFTGARNSVCVGGYLNVDGPADEEMAGKLLGTHSSTEPNSGSYVVGIRLDGSGVRLRKEIHPDYTSSINPVSLSLGDLRKKWIGYQYAKINTGNNVLIQAYIDISGFDANGKPQNNWKKIYEIIDDGTIASGKWQPIWLTPSLGPKKSQNTIRVDEQKKSTYNYKYVFCREITTT